jgi:hypothetical protein
LIILCRIDLLSLGVRHFAEWMFFARRIKNEQTAYESYTGPPEEKSHDALAH